MTCISIKIVGYAAEVKALEAKRGTNWKRTTEDLPGLATIRAALPIEGLS
jgi:hypothetical protein